jgi:hypothetical protein
MAKIQIYRSETQRVMPQGQPLSLKAPDQGIVGRAVSQFGEVLGNIAEERAKIGAAAKAAAAHSGYRNDMLGVERAARRMKPEDAEAYYLQHSTNAYNKANNSLSSSYSKSLFAAPAGQTAYTSRSKFYKEHDARLVSTAIATGEFNAANFAGTAANLGLKPRDRLTAAKSAIAEFTNLAESGAINPEDAVKRQRKWAGATLETILRAHMLNSEDPVKLVDSFKNGKLGDEVAYVLAKAVDDDELIKIKIRMEKAAHRIETGRRQKETADAKAITADNKRLLGELYGVDKDMQGGAAAALLQAQQAYRTLKISGGLGSKAAIENAQEWLGSLGDPRFQDAADAVPYRTVAQGSKQASVDRLWLAESRDELTQAMVTAEKAGLTAADYKGWKGRVEVEREKGITDAIKLFDARFKFTRNMNQGDMLETEQSNAAYYKSVEELRSWKRDNRAVSYTQTMEKGKAIMQQRTIELQEELREEFLMTVGYSKRWKQFLAPVIGGKHAGTDDALTRARVFVVQNKDSTVYRTAIAAIKQMKQWQSFGVDLTMPVGP